jgi:hypothetical protein
VDDRGPDVCPNGHEIGPGQSFCSECGAPVQRAETATISPLVRGKRRAALVIAGVVVVALTALVGVLVTRGGGTDGAGDSSQSLTVNLVREGTGSAATCQAGSIVDGDFAGTQIAVENAEGTKIGAGSIASGAQYDEENATCTWAGAVSIEDTDAYTVNLRTPSGSEEQFTYSRSDLQQDGWTVSLTVAR